MIEPTLYQTGTDEELFDLVFMEYGATSTAIVRAVKMWLTEVVRCEHGNIDGHPVPIMAYHIETGQKAWCPGAGIGDDEAPHYPDDWFEAHGENQR